MDNTMLIGKVCSGFRHPKPAKCPEPVYAILLRMWAADPSNRPTFADIIPELEALHAEENERYSAEVAENVAKAAASFDGCVDQNAHRFGGSLLLRWRARGAGYLTAGCCQLGTNRWLAPAAQSTAPGRSSLGAMLGTSMRWRLCPALDRVEGTTPHLLTMAALLQLLVTEACIPPIYKTSRAF